MQPDPRPTMLPVPRRGGPPQRGRPLLRRLVAPTVVLLAVSLASPAPAFADAGESRNEGYIIVQQALSYLVTDPGPNGVASALQMVDDALAAKDQDGVDVAAVQQARSALAGGNTQEARTLLQGSIRAALAARGPATGEETGTTVVLPPLAARASLSATDWLFLVLSVLTAIAGVALSVVFRPREGLRELRRDIEAAAHAAAIATDRRNP